MAKAQSTGAWQPKVFGLVLLVALLVLGVREVLNTFNHPTLRRIASLGNPQHTVALYQKGRPQAREAWLFVEPEGVFGPPLCFQRIDCSAQGDTRTGLLSWTADGQAIYASRRKTHDARNVAAPLWMYDLRTHRLYAVDGSIVGPEVSWTPASEPGLQNLISQHGGGGHGVISWYELGRESPLGSLLSWQTTRWEQAMPK